MPQLPAADAKGDPADVVGPVCESSDVLGRDRPLAAGEGDGLAILGAGAYGFGMASNYNTRNRPAEVLLEAGHAHLVRRRERHEDQFTLESLSLPGGECSSSSPKCMASGTASPSSIF